MASDPPPPWWAYVVALGILGGLVGLLAFALWPEGERVAEIDLVRGGAVELPLEKGDSLHFRADLVVDIDASVGDASRRREHRIHDALRASPITIVVEGPGGERSATCGAYDGQVVSAVVTAGSHTLSGVALACTVPIEATGPHAVRANATWKQGLRVSVARLEIRRAAAPSR